MRLQPANSCYVGYKIVSRWPKICEVLGLSSFISSDKERNEISFMLKVIQKSRLFSQISQGQKILVI